ncbi:MAG: TupA-like ATPgrasp [Marinobacter excellens HL-55]|uniref:TupA-like ATPgrasp n=1 Tax=Marinobacter excellens HL-55 TaxID=1305731 RepID=A0A0P8CZZ9_9GAMM|nr:MAG: TupA-like ATPgrasp [Marinobacter excellens HL-55]
MLVGDFYMHMPASKRLLEIILFVYHLLLFLTKPGAFRRYLKITKTLPFFAVPKTYNEKYLWRKFVDHDPRFTILSDKLACKSWVAKRAPELRMANVVWQSDNPDDLLALPDFMFKMPLAFKSNHGQGDVCIFENGVSDVKSLREAGGRMLAFDHGKANHEWGYFNIPRTLFFEELIMGQGCELSEVKIYTFGQDVKRIVHIGGRSDSLWANAWELDSEGLVVPSAEKAALGKPNEDIKPPALIDKAIALAKMLGRDFDHMRVDLYWDGRELWFGEMTVYNQAGYHKQPSGNSPDSELSRAWDIRSSHFMRKAALNCREKIYRNLLSSIM